MVAARWSAFLVLLTCGVLSSPIESLEPSDIDIQATVQPVMEQPKVQGETLLDETAANKVRIWDKSFTKQAVSTAQTQLHAVVEKLGRRHPEILGEAATIKQFANEPESLGSIQGGIEALRGVLDKVDGTRRNLEEEKREVKEGIESMQKRCASDVGNAKDTIGTKESALSAGKTNIDQKRTRIAELRGLIKSSQMSEAGEQASSYESQMSEKRKQMTRGYNDYWIDSDKNGKTRDVLMEVLWLVCYGFSSFSQQQFCEDLRKEPDFQEPRDKPLDASGVRYRSNVKITNQFAEYMKPIWKQQKLADLHLANADGDPSLNKGFLRGQAPFQSLLGIDEEAQREMDSLLEEQVGVTEGQNRKQFADRLESLLEASDIPDTIAIPVQGLTQLLQTATEDTASQGAVDSAQSLVKTLVRLDSDLGKDQAAADDNWFKSHKALSAEMHGLLQQMEQEGSEQDRDMQEIARLEIDMKTIRSMLHGHEASIALSAQQMNQIIEDCERNYVAEWARLNAIEDELVNIQRLNSLLRFLAVGEDPAPSCTAASGVPCDKGSGSCTWKTRGETSDPNHEADGDQSSVFCACEPEWYGVNCELKKCPGLGRLKYKNDQDGVCSNRGGDCDGQHCASAEMSTGCNDDGSCTCNANYYHGQQNKCENKYCKANNGETTDCGGNSRGKCNNRHGVCECEDRWYGDRCHLKKCPATNPDGADPDTVIGYFKGTNPTACDGRGACTAEGVCKCGHYAGQACQDACGMGENKVDCSGGRGTCQPNTGLCQCNAPYSGAQCTHDSGHCRDCRFTSCPADCSNGGVCDRIVGRCTCHNGNYNGARCDEPSQFAETIVDWSRSMDKWGWSLCPEGSLLAGLSRDSRGHSSETADALYNIKSAKCRQPSEGPRDVTSQTGTTIELGHCYHENWWRKFDYKGGKFCRRNYFVAGLFRSHCNSLYCLEMAKCCQVQRSLWNDCKWVRMSEWKEAEKFSETDLSGSGKMAKAFIAGFYRGNSHTLDGLQYMRQCVPVFWGADNRDN